ncbi:hypothetical protein Tco_0076471, partial [Tanacetum coccineum]
ISYDDTVPHGHDGGEVELLYPKEYLNTLSFAGLPPHRYKNISKRFPPTHPSNDKRPTTTLYFPPMRRHEWQCQAADDFAVRHIMRTQALEAGARVDTLEDTGSSS